LSKSPKKQSLNDFAEYLQLAYQIVAVLLISFYIGNYCDKILHHNKPWCTLLFAVIAVITSLYLLIKKITKP
jgi:F0F1-type ATP synthase assembly protein I